MAYKVLLILPTLYRRWASARLHELYPWVEGWADQSMYAGIPGRGDVPAQPGDDAGIDAEARAAGQRFAGELEQYPAHGG